MKSASSQGFSQRIKLASKTPKAFIRDWRCSESTTVFLRRSLTCLSSRRPHSAPCTIRKTPSAIRALIGGAFPFCVGVIVVIGSKNYDISLVLAILSPLRFDLNVSDPSRSNAKSESEFDDDRNVNQQHTYSIVCLKVDNEVVKSFPHSPAARTSRYSSNAN